MRQDDAEQMLFTTPTALGRDEENRIPTWGADGGLNRQIVAHLQAAAALFRASGIDWTFGREQEFTLRALGNRDGETFRTQKIAELTPPLERRLEQEGIAAPGRQTLVRAFEKMPLQDVFMTELHLRLSQDLEPRFGRGARGFYDPQGVLEVSTRPADPVGDVVRWHRLQRELQNLAADYDFSVTYFKRDITFQATDTKTGQPIFSTTPDQPADRRAVPLAQGILRVVHEALPIFMKPMQITDHIQQIDMGYGRHHALRSRHDRLELRTNHNPLAGSHPALENLLLLAGARYGLGQKADAANVLAPCAFQEKTVFTAPGDKLFFLTELLNAAELTPQGTLRLPTMREAMKYAPYLDKEVQRRDGASVAGWISQVKITPEGVQWPPAADLSTEPERLQRELSRVEYGAKTRRLVSHGYTADQGIGETPHNTVAGRTARLLQAVDTMAQSPVLHTVFGADFATELAQSFVQRYAPAPANKPQRGANSNRGRLDTPVA